MGSALEWVDRLRGNNLLEIEILDAVIPEALPLDVVVPGTVPPNAVGSLGDGDDALVSRNAVKSPIRATKGVFLFAFLLDEEISKLHLAGLLEFVKTEPEQVLLYVSHIFIHSVKLEAVTAMKLLPLIVALQYIRYTLPLAFSKIEWHSGCPLAIGSDVAVGEPVNGDEPAAADETVLMKELEPLSIDRDEVALIEEVAEGIKSEDDPILVLELFAPIATRIEDNELVAATGVTEESEVEKVEDDAVADVSASLYTFKELIDQ